jgi:isopenicillin N synthase-like dioxygenase
MISFDHMTTTTTAASIPTIDFSPFLENRGVVVNEEPTKEQLEVAKSIDHACREHGFIYIQNFGLTPELCQEAFQASASLFDIKDKTKLSRFNPQTNMGFSPFQSESLNRSRPAELKEAFNVRFPPTHCNDLTGCPEGYASVVDRLQATLKEAARRYAMACALALGLPTTFFSSTLEAFDLCTIRMLHYPPCDFDATSEQVDKPLRIGEHTDFGAYTFLLLGDHGAEGLQIKPVQGGEVGGLAGGETEGWQHVDTGGVAEQQSTTVGAIVNTGALMARWTNDEWRATAHRVVVSDETMASRHRYSIAFFVDPDTQSMVEVHHKFTHNGTAPKKYAPISSVDYLTEKLQSMMSQKPTV